MDTVRQNNKLVLLWKHIYLITIKSKQEQPVENNWSNLKPSHSSMKSTANGHLDSIHKPRFRLALDCLEDYLCYSFLSNLKEISPNFFHWGCKKDLIEFFLHFNIDQIKITTNFYIWVEYVRTVRIHEYCCININILCITQSRDHLFTDTNCSKL